jgi:GT2 family glycosyltransferase
MISFVIPLHNHLSVTQAMLASLREFMPTGIDHEIIFVDDTSTDGTGEWLRSLRDPCIKFLINDVNCGYAASNNVGVNMAKGDVLALLNNDLLLSPGWLEPMLAALNSNALNVGLVGNLQYRLADGEVDHAGVELSPMGQMQHLRTIADEPIIKSFAVTGACMLLRKADFIGVGGFDESYVNGCEDIDLCFKFQALNKGVFLACKSRIQHHVSLSRKTNTLKDLQNSRLLFSRWRIKIKSELSRIWRELLAAGPSTYANIWPEPIEEEYLATPWALSLYIAETVLRREEEYWARILDGDSKCRQPFRFSQMTDNL